MQSPYTRNEQRNLRVIADDGDVDSHAIRAVPEPRQYRLLLPVLEATDDDASERLLRAGTTIVNNWDGEVLIACIVHVPEQTPYGVFSDDESLMREVRERTERLVECAQEFVPARGVICLAHHEDRAIINVIERHGCHGTLLEVSSDHSQRWRLLSGATVEKVVARAPSDVFVLKLVEEDDLPKRLLVAVSGGPHSGLAVETACAIARELEATIDIVHFLPEDMTERQQNEGQRTLDAAARVVEGVDCTTELVAGEDVATEIVNRSGSYDMTVLGSPTKGLLKQFIFGTVPDSVNRGAEQPVLMAKQGSESNPSIFYRWLLDE